MFFDTRKSTTNKIQTRFNSINGKFGVCACVKNNSFANFTQEKKRMSCISLLFVSFFNVFHCFLLFINATLNYICTHLRRNVLNCWNSVCMWVCVCICFLRLITRGRGTQQRKLILGTEYLHNEDSPTHFDSLIQFNLSFRAISVKGLNLL